MRQICRKRQAPRWTSRPREHICVNRVCWCLKYSFHLYTKKAVKWSLGKMIDWRCFCQISDLCAAWELHLWNLCSCSSRLAASLKWGPSFFFFFPLRFLLLDVTLCHSHSRYAALSISIIAAPLGRGETSKPLFVCECGCLCIKEGCPCSFHAQMWQTVSVCASACLCMFCVHLCVFYSLLLHHCHPSVCRLPKPEAPVGFWGASGRKRNDWAITLLLFSPQRCSSPPRLVFLPGGLCCEGLFFFRSVSLSRSLLADNVDDLPPS